MREASCTDFSIALSMPAAERLKSVPTMLDSFIPDANLVGLVQEDDESNDFDFQDEGSDVGDTREQCLPLAGGLGHRIFFNIVSPCEQMCWLGWCCRR